MTFIAPDGDAWPSEMHYHLSMLYDAVGDVRAVPASDGASERPVRELAHVMAKVGAFLSEPAQNQPVEERLRYVSKVAPQWKMDDFGRLEERARQRYAEEIGEDAVGWDSLQEWVRVSWYIEVWDEITQPNEVDESIVEKLDQLLEAHKGSAEVLTGLTKVMLDAMEAEDPMDAKLDQSLARLKGHDESSRAHFDNVVRILLRLGENQTLFQTRLDQALPHVTGAPQTPSGGHQEVDESAFEKQVRDLYEEARSHYDVVAQVYKAIQRRKP